MKSMKMRQYGREVDDLHSIMRQDREVYDDARIL